MKMRRTIIIILLTACALGVVAFFVLKNNKTQNVGVTEDSTELILVSKKVGDVIFSYEAPQGLSEFISYEVVNKKMDNLPEGFSLDSIGGEVSYEHKKQSNGLLISQYDFITAVNYKWSMVEVDMEESHIEIGYTYKTPFDVMPTHEQWTNIINSFSIQ
jgi:hypothetical protein